MRGQPETHQYRLRLEQVESLLDRLSSTGCLEDWADEKERTTAFMALVKTVQYEPTAWPSWLLLKLSAAVNRALQDEVLGLSAAHPRNHFIAEPYGVGSHARKRVILDALVSVGQLKTSLTKLCQAVLEGVYSGSPGPAVLMTGSKDTLLSCINQGTGGRAMLMPMTWYQMHNELRYLVVCCCTAGLLFNMARTANELVEFISKHKLLQLQADSTLNPRQVELQVTTVGNNGTTK